MKKKMMSRKTLKKIGVLKFLKLHDSLRETLLKHLLMIF